MRWKFVSTSGVIGLALTVAGCTMFSDPPPPCPRASVLGDAARLVRFQAGEGRDLTDVEHEAEIAVVGLACDYDDDEVVNEVTIQVAAIRGPAARGSETEMSYFVAYIHGERGIQEKAVFTSAITFKEGRRRGGVQEEVEVVIPITAKAQGPEYEIIAGFQLTPEQLAYNRSQRR